MGKYWAIFKITWQNAVEYRMEFLAHMGLGLIELVVMYYIWSAVFKNRTYFGNYTFPSMITYLIMVRFLHFVRRSGSLKVIAEEIKDGKISVYLVKPVSYIKWCFSNFLAERSFESVLRILMLIILLLFFPKIFVFSGIRRFLAFLVLLTSSLVFNFLFNISISFLAFFVTDVRFFRTTVLMIGDFFAGALIPLDLMPGVLKKISFLLPFQFWIYFPIKFYQGQLTLNHLIEGFFLLGFWILIFFGLVIFLWRRGIKTYEAVGQ